MPYATCPYVGGTCEHEIEPGSPCILDCERYQTEASDGDTIPGFGITDINDGPPEDDPEETLEDILDEFDL